MQDISFSRLLTLALNTPQRILLFGFYSSSRSLFRAPQSPPKLSATPSSSRLNGRGHVDLFDKTGTCLLQTVSHLHAAS